MNNETRGSCRNFYIYFNKIQEIPFNVKHTLINILEFKNEFSQNSYFIASHLLYRKRSNNKMNILSHSKGRGCWWVRTQRKIEKPLTVKRDDDRK